jgi:hypothetical protein
MARGVNLNDIVGSAYLNPAAYNTNNTSVETELSRAFSRHGVSESNNELLANIDFNNNTGINVAAPTADGHIVNKAYGDANYGGDAVIGAEAAQTAAEAAQAAAETAQTNAETAETNAETAETGAEAAEALAQDWATLLDAQVEATDYSSKEYAIGTTVPAGSSKDWATQLVTEVDGSEFSAKEWSIGDDATEGSAKRWATEAEDVTVDGSEFSAKHYSAKASGFADDAEAASGTVLITANDTTAAVLDTSLLVSSNLTKNVDNPAGDETLTLDTAHPQAPDISGGDALKLLRVNAGETALEYAAPAAARGALVYNNPATGSGTPIDFTSEAYDTDAIHDNSTNPEMLTVPSGVTLVRLTANVAFNGSTAFTLHIHKNTGVNYAGRAIVQHIDAVSQAGALNITSPILSVVGGDYFRLIPTGATVPENTTGTTTWFAMEIIA